MSEEAQVNDKVSESFAPEDEAAITWLVELHSKSSDLSNPVDYIRPATYSFDWPVIQKKLERLEALGFVKVDLYIPPRTGQPNPNVLQVNLTPSGMQLVRARVTQTTTTTTVIEPEMSEYDVTERRRMFARTERGNAILSACPEAIASDVRSHIQAIRSQPDKSKFRLHQVWLRYALLWRWADIPEDIRHEAEDCRDLEYAARRDRKRLKT